MGIERRKRKFDLVIPNASQSIEQAGSVKVSCSNITQFLLHYVVQNHKLLHWKQFKISFKASTVTYQYGCISRR